MKVEHTEFLTPQAVTWENMSEGSWDALVVIGPSFAELPEDYQAAITAAKATDASVDEQLSVVACDKTPGGRLVIVPTGPLDRDYDDVRRFYDAARDAVTRIAQTGAKQPVIMTSNVPAGEAWENASGLSFLGLQQGRYEPLEAREHFGKEVEAFTAIGVLGNTELNWLDAVEQGRRVARDICGTEPERMSPMKAAEYCKQAFADTDVKVTVFNDRLELQHEYPLLSAVARASFAVEQQRPCVVRLEYEGEGPITDSLFLVGKGITYDTGGADLKTGGHMAGMSRDKGGAAGVAGFIKAVAGVRPKGLRVVAELAFVRNNIGSLAFVADEIITGRSGVRVRIGNTDAEGRLVLADSLAKLKDEAVSATNPSLYTVATLTGHAALAKGPYSALVPNGPALKSGLAQRIVDAGEEWGDGAEISFSRREDFDFVRGRTKADDVLSSNNGPSATTARGHQFPMAFLVLVSGLDQHGLSAEKPLPYTHIDIAGSGVEGGDWQHGKPSAAPVLALAGSFLR